MTATCTVCLTAFEFSLRGKTPLTCSDQCRRDRLNARRRARLKKPDRHVVCLHHECRKPFVAATVQGAQRQTCSPECAAARKAYFRRTVRRERYQALIAAGAYQAVASDGSQGLAAFEATLQMLKDNPHMRKPPPAPPAPAEPAEPRSSQKALRRALDALAPTTVHPWRERKRRAA